MIVKVMTDAVRKVKMTTETDILIDMQHLTTLIVPHMLILCNKTGNKKGGTLEETASSIENREASRSKAHPYTIISTPDAC